MIGSAVLHYRIEKKLGEGGMGEVYLALDTRLDRRVALKFLSARTSSDPLARERLTREAKSASSLNHPNILTIHSVEDGLERPFIVMEYVEGHTLAEMLAARKLELPEILVLAEQIASGLAAAHERGVIHRDLKPANVIVDGRGHAKIMDFGLAKAAHQPALTQSGSTVGTLAYMSPEQVRGETIDARSDLFSFGALLYELVAGRSPFDHPNNVAAVLHSILNDEPAPLARSRPDTPAELQRIVARALEKDRDRRYPNAAELASDLAVLSRAASSGAMASFRRATPHPMRRASTWIAAGAIAALALVAWRPWRERERERAVRAAPFAIASQQMISFVEGAPSQPSLSPDGALVAFVDAKDGVAQLWVTDLAESKPVQLTFGTRDVVRPRWSPAGNRIAYFEKTDPRHSTEGTIFTISPLGGAPREVIDRGTNPSWSADGETLVFERDRDIWRASADGANARKIENLPSGMYVTARTPALSPDGQKLAFFQPQMGPLGELWIASSDGTNAKMLVAGVDILRDPTWTADGKQIVYSSMRSGSTNLWRASAEDGTVSPLTTGAGDDVQPTLSRDAKKLVFTNQRPECKVVIWDPSTDTERVVRASRSSMLHPGFAPDGKRVAVFGSAGPGTQILTLDVANGDVVELTPRSELSWFPEWSGDGRSIYYYYQGGPEGSAFRRVDASSRHSEVVFDGWVLQTQLFPAVDPTDKRVMCMVLHADSMPTGLMVDLATREETQLRFPMLRPAWAKDAERVVAEGPPGRVVIYDVDTEQTEIVGEGQVPRWSADGGSVYFLRPRPGGWKLWVHDLVDGTEREVHDLGPMYEQAQRFDVGPSGEIVWSRYDKGPSELWLIEFE